VTELAPEAEAPAPDVAARGGSYYRNARFILSVGLIAFGLACIRDGFFKWPRENADAVQQGFDKAPHSDMDLLFNRVMGVGLPPLSVLLICWTLYNSRGEFRLTGQTLHVPGHPPLPLSNIDSLDKGMWDRKGIATATYRLETGQAGKFKLDDFVYERDAIDEIVRRIELSLLPPDQEPPVEMSA
jgi:hypothetical protein